MRRNTKALLGNLEVTVILTARDGRVWVRDAQGDNYICRRWQLTAGA